MYYFEERFCVNISTSLKKQHLPRQGVAMAICGLHL